MEPERKRKEVEEQSQGWQNRAVWDSGAAIGGERCDGPKRVPWVGSGRWILPLRERERERGKGQQNDRGPEAPRVASASSEQKKSAESQS